jgi:PEP-CTERM motif-containing protein
MGRQNRAAVVALFASVAILWSAAPARAATISLGSLSFDQFIPAFPDDPSSVGTNAFNVFNASGDFASPPDPASLLNPADPVSLLDAALLLTDVDGNTTSVALGTIAPGLVDDGAGSPLFGLQFADTTRFTSAVFTATLGSLSFLLTDGTTFQASSADLLFTLAALPGSFLAPNPLADPLTFVSFDISGDVVPPESVPEPGTLMLLASGLGAAFVARKRLNRVS